MSVPGSPKIIGTEHVWNEMLVPQSALNAYTGICAIPEGAPGERKEGVGWAPNFQTMVVSLFEDLVHVGPKKSYCNQYIAGNVLRETIISKRRISIYSLLAWTVNLAQTWGKNAVGTLCKRYFKNAASLHNLLCTLLRSSNAAYVVQLPEFLIDWLLYGASTQ
jgi:hypothetical protein